MNPADCGIVTSGPMRTSVGSDYAAAQLRQAGYFCVSAIFSEGGGFSVFRSEPSRIGLSIGSLKWVSVLSFFFCFKHFHPVENGFYQTTRW